MEWDDARWWTVVLLGLGDTLLVALAQLIDLGVSREAKHYLDRQKSQMADV